MLEAEEKESREIILNRLATWHIDKLKEEGYCLTGLKAFWLTDNHFGRPVATFTIGPGEPLPEHKFTLVSIYVNKEFNTEWVAAGMEPRYYSQLSKTNPSQKKLGEEVLSPVQVLR